MDDDPFDTPENRELDDLLVRADSLCSLILYREGRGLSQQTLLELQALCNDLRVETMKRGR